jgi:hypothetical protein
VTNLATTFQAHECEPVVVEVKNLDGIQTKLFRAARQDDRRICDRPVSLMGLSPLRMFALRLALGPMDQSASSIAPQRKTSGGAIDHAAAHALSMLSCPKKWVCRDAAANYRASDLVRWHGRDLATTPANVRSLA